jgi:hypothetical protein
MTDLPAARQQRSNERLKARKGQGFRDMSAFYFNASSGVRAPWRFLYLLSGGYGGLAGALGGGTPGAAGWSGRPRISAARVKGLLPEALSKVPVAGNLICHDVREMKIS